jgi:hypothetical protein
VAAATTTTPASGGGDAKKSDVSKEPVAKIDALTGKQTAVKLDAGFVEGITGLGLAPV